MPTDQIRRGDPTACYVCDKGPHADTTAQGGHRYWPTHEARIELALDADERDDALPERPEGYYHQRPDGEV